MNESKILFGPKILSALKIDFFLRNFVQFKFINFNNIFLKIKKNNKLRKHKKFRYKKIYILGSANSILKLNNIQKKEISKYPTISINGYLLFWEKVQNCWSSGIVGRDWGPSWDLYSGKTFIPEKKIQTKEGN